MSKLVVSVLALLGVAVSGAFAAEPLTLDVKIPLGDVAGRIDHLAIDLRRQTLFVAELGNDTVGVVDLGQRQLRHRITGLKEPQGVAYAETADLLYVANAGDGTVRWYRAADFALVGTLKLGSDADNLRVDRSSGDVVAGYGTGALAVLDAGTGRKKADIRLPAHPESFQLASDGRVFINVPDARQVAVVDRAAGRQVAHWGIEAAGNFPMALDEAGQRLIVAYRSPATLAIFDTAKGSPIASFRTCDDADDVFVDARRRRIYVSCGEGVLAVIQQDGTGYRDVARIKTSSGARTSLFVPELDRLFLAVRTRGREPAAIWIYRPEL
ncbi:MAG TPA: hypothetical protein VGB82_24800 [Alphaproteobacteria bacterium]